MSKVFGVILVISAVVGCLEAVTESQCRSFPTKNRHCHLEGGTWQRYKNEQVERYVFDWSSQKCVVWHWWTDPSRCSIPVGENNFASNNECMDACSGWAK